MSALSNTTPTPHRGIRVTPQFPPYRPPLPGYVGAHRLDEEQTPDEFRAMRLVETHKVSRGVQR